MFSQAPSHLSASCSPGGEQLCPATLLHHAVPVSSQAQCDRAEPPPLKPEVKQTAASSRLWGMLSLMRLDHTSLQSFPRLTHCICLCPQVWVCSVCLLLGSAPRAAAALWPCVCPSFSSPCLRCDRWTVAVCPWL